MVWFETDRLFLSVVQPHLYSISPEKEINVTYTVKRANTMYIQCTCIMLFLVIVCVCVCVHAHSSGIHVHVRELIICSL